MILCKIIKIIIKQWFVTCPNQNCNLNLKGWVPWNNGDSFCTWQESCDTPPFFVQRSSREICLGEHAGARHTINVSMSTVRTNNNNVIYVYLHLPPDTLFSQEILEHLCTFLWLLPCLSETSIAWLVLQWFPKTKHYLLFRTEIFFNKQKRLINCESIWAFERLRDWDNW